MSEVCDKEEGCVGWEPHLRLQAEGIHKKTAHVIQGVRERRNNTQQKQEFHAGDNEQPDAELKAPNAKWKRVAVAGKQAEDH